MVEDFDLLNGFLQQTPASFRTFDPAIIYYFMKTLLKFTLLSALIISGKIAKQPAQATAAKKPATEATANNSIILVHQVLTSEPVQPVQEPTQRQTSGSGLLAELF